MTSATGKQGDGSPWPNLYFVGVPKAGTTYLSEVLASHPLIYCSRIKSPNFMNSDITMADLPSGDDIPADGIVHAAVIRDEEEYLSLYAGGRNLPVRADCSMDYLRSGVAARNIVARAPAAKIIAVLRNPIERCLSHFLMDARIGRSVGTFDEAIEHHLASVGTNDFWGGNYIETGFYDQQLTRYFDVFPAENLLIGLYDDLKADGPAFVSRIFRHIDVGEIALPGGRPQNVAALARGHRLNRWLYETGLKERISRIVPVGPKRILKKYYYREIPRGEQRMSPAQYARLAEIFRDHIVELSRMLDRDLTPWLAGGKVSPHWD